MTKIQLLPDQIIDKIAAGEVVERPASVVKELVENSIDAGADVIEIILEDAGKEQITIVDNGGGMAKEDLLLAVKRHATSKIISVDDLYSIHTMGFRGEALASIASVSDLHIASKLPSGSAWKLCCTAGEVVDLHETHASGIMSEHGTLISIKNLFYNVPARLKFLKSSPAEFSAIVDIIEGIALVNPHLKISLKHNGKNVSHFERVENPRRHSQKMSGENASPFFGEDILRKRVAQIFGEEFVRDLIYAQKQNTIANIEVLTSAPGHERTQAKYIYGFVNDRMIRDKNIRFAVMRAYKSYLLSGKYPTTFCYVNCDPSLVDVNVHPAKFEIRFQYDQDVQSLIALTIREGIRAGGWAFSPSENTVMASAETDRSLRFARDDNADPVIASAAKQSVPYNITDRSLRFARDDNNISHSIDRYIPSTKINVSSFEPFKKEPSKLIDFSELKFIGTFAKCYLIFEHQITDEMLVIDQHAFHERILYERFLKDKSLLGHKQPMLIPEILTLDHGSITILKERIGLLNQIGFDISFVDMNTLSIEAVPTLLTKKDLTPIIEKLAEDSAIYSTEFFKEDLYHHMLATMACHSAVRSGEELGVHEISKLLRDAQDIDFYHNCPHGRRVLKWWSKSEVSRWFDR